MKTKDKFIPPPKLDLSVVIPLYEEEENVDLLHKALNDVLSPLEYTYEIILVDDGSKDSTPEKLKAIARRDSHMKAILFRANCGQSAATDAGFELATGKVIIVMDGDLQNDPKDIPKLLEKMAEGYDLVSGWRKDRKDKLILRKIPSRIANKIICSVTRVDLHDTGCALKAYRYNIVKKINLYGELHRFLPALAKVEGAIITEIPVRHHARKFGNSKYGIARTFKVIMDLMSLNIFIKYLQSPLLFFGKISLFYLLCTFLATIGLVNGFVFNSYEAAEMNILIIISFLFLASCLQYVFLGLVASLITSTGSKKANYFSELIRD